MSKRDALAERYAVDVCFDLQVKNERKPVTDFKAGWDACHNEYQQYTRNLRTDVELALKARCEQLEGLLKRGRQFLTFGDNQNCKIEWVKEVNRALEIAGQSVPALAQTEGKE